MGIHPLNCCSFKHRNYQTEIEIKKQELLKNSFLNSSDILSFLQSTISKNSPNSTKYPNKETIEKKIILIQSVYRRSKSQKDFSNHLELLHTIYSLDSTLNLINSQEEAEQILQSNKGEMLSRSLIKEKKILPYPIKPTNSKYLINSPLTYVDKYKNKNLYKGYMTLEKIFQGYGALYSNNNKYEGIWEKGKLNGYSRYFLSSGDYYEGNIINDIVDGEGKYINIDGSSYEGYWENGLPNGKGKEIYFDGTIFEGLFIKGEKIKGKKIWKDGTYYEGEYQYDFFHGKGKFHWREGIEYIGDWKGGKMIGKGVMKYIDGSYYEGEFENGKRNGVGKFVWNSDKYYEGDWKEGKPHGNGVYRKGEVEKKGMWFKGKMTNEEGSRSITLVYQDDSANIKILNEKIVFNKINKGYESSARIQMEQPMETNTKNVKKNIKNKK